METEKEKCVACGIDTDVPINQHIDQRFYYVEGSGQLCRTCWEKIYGSEGPEV